MGNMIRKGKVNFDQAVRQVKMFIPEEYKRAAFDSLEACRGSGKKIECDWLCLSYLIKMFNQQVMV